MPRIEPGVAACKVECPICCTVSPLWPFNFEPATRVYISLCNFSLSLIGMPDFLEKLHTATLKAKNMEIKVKDYISAKSLEMGSEAKTNSPSSERKNEGSCGPARIEYA